MRTLIKALLVCLVLILTVTPAWAAFTVDLYPGQNHLQVKELQQLLNQKGYTVAQSGDGSKGFETTIMGPATVAALKRFQLANNITPTGIVGPLTRVALNQQSTAVPLAVVTPTKVTPPKTPIMSFVLMDLYPDMDHPQVKVLQQILNYNGYVVAFSGEGSEGFETTIMGPATVSAVKRFQAVNGVKVTGVVEIMTRIALLRTQLSNLMSYRPTTTIKPIASTSILPTSTTPLSTTTKVTATTTTKKRSGGGGSSSSGGSSGGGGGSTVTPAPVATITVSSSTVTSGAAVTVTWSATNATACTGTNFSTASATSGSTVVNPTASTTYSVSCTGAGGTDTETVTVTVVSITAPIATLSVSSTTVASGTAVTITWSSTNATSCTGTNFSTATATSGSTVVNPTTSTTYSISCTGADGTDTDSATVTVAAAPAPVASLSVSSTTVASGASVTITWSATNATSCTGTNFSTGSATSGSTVVNPTASTTYSISCTGAGGTDTDAATVTVVPAPVASLSASPTSIASGATVTLTWSATNATSCTGTNFSTGSATSGSATVNPTASTTYSISCTGVGGTDTDAATVTVLPAPVATLSLSSSTVASGTAVTITWSSTNATSCTGTNFSTATATSGSTVVNPTASTTYSISCTGAGGTDTDSATVTVTTTPAPVATFSASPTTVASGDPVTLAWSSTNATSCAGTNFSTSGSASSTVVVNPTVTTTYTLTCTGAGGTDVETATVTVSGGGTNITLSVEASRVSGVAPLAVFFDATETTDTDTTRPFSDLEYRWNFGDPTSGTWDFGARPGVSSRNEATGGIAAHVFETPGTYTVTVDVTGESGTESTDITITVTDPDIVFSGTATRCISRVGDFTGCPSGAQQVTTTDMAVAESHIATGRRILFKRGETWPDSITMNGINGPGILGSYGSGASPIFTNLYTGGGGVSDWRTMDLDFVRPVGADLYTTAVEVVHPSSRFTFLRVKATGAGTGADGTFLTFAMNIFDTPSSVNQHVEHAIVDSEITDGRYAFYGAGDKLAFMGNYLYSSGDNQHVYRSFYANKGVNSNNTLAGGGDAGGWGPISLVKQHAPDQPGAYSEYLHWSDNRFAPTNVYVSLGFGSENGITDQRLRHVVVERNWFSAQYNAQLSVNMASGYDYTVRNNLFVMDNYWGTGVQVQHSSTGPVTDQVEIYNNTFYKSDGGGNGMDAIQAMDGVTNVTIRNNLAYAPNASNPVMVSLLGGTTVTQSNNSSDTQVRTVSPAFLSATPTTLAHFDLLAGSYARNAGFTVPVYRDLLDRLRPQGASFDLGAIEGE